MPISHRFSQHKAENKLYPGKVSSSIVLGYGAAYCELLEAVNVETSRELRAIEDVWIARFPTAVNIAKAGAANGTDIYCHACGHLYRKSDRTRHSKFPKHIKNMFNQLPGEY